MNIFLTIDVETYTGDYETDVWGKGLGLRYILNQLKRHRLQATFFVEALGATQWGAEPLTKICKALKSAGQDVQLHVHPIVARIEGHASTSDKLYDYDVETQGRLIAMGSDILSECGAEPPEVFRAGDLAADSRTLFAMREEGIRVGSNRDLDIKSSIRSRLNSSFPILNDVSMADGMTDIPVSAFQSPFPRMDGIYRHLEICAVGAGEMRDVLKKMAAAGYSCATILMHPQEFFRVKGDKAVPIRKNCRRLEKLLSFLASRKDMKVLPMKRRAEVEVPSRSPVIVRGSLIWGAQRVIQQAMERVRVDCDIGRIRPVQRDSVEHQAIEFYKPDRVPAELLKWWKDTIKKQDPIGCLVRSAAWYRMMDKGMGLVAVLRGDGAECRALLALFPGETTVKAMFGRTVLCSNHMQILRVCGGDVVGDAVEPSGMTALLTAVFEKYPAADAILFNHTHQRRTKNPPSPRLRRPGQERRTGLSSSGLFFTHPKAHTMPHYRMKLPKTLEECMSARSPKSIKKIQGRERALGRELGGDCTVVEIRCEKDWKPYAKKIEDLMNATWQADRLGHKCGVDDMKRVAKEGWLRSFLLLVGDKAIAFAFCFQGDDTLIYEQIGYDRDLGKHSPGTILLYRMFEKLYESDRPAYVDFGEGEAEYKKLLADDVIQVGSCFVVRNRGDLKRWFAFKRCCDAVNRLAKRVLPRSVVRIRS